MAQFDHLLPDGTTLHTIDVTTAQKYLRRMVWSFMEGSDNQLIIGTAERAQAVALGPDAWVHDIGLRDRQIEPNAENLANQRLDNAEREWQSEEHFSALLAAPRDRADPERSAPPFRDLQMVAVDVQTVAQLLPQVIEGLESGAVDVVILGEGGDAEGVIIPVDHWLDYLDLEDEDEADERIANIVRERIANDDPSTWVSDEEFRARIKDPRTRDD